MIMLKQSTSVVINFGPAVSKTDAVTLQTGLVSALDNATTGIMLSKNGGTLAVRHATVTASAYDAYGFYKVTLDTTDTGTLGILLVTYQDATTLLPVWMYFAVVPANVYDCVINGTDNLDVNVQEWNDAAVASPATAGIPDVNVKNINNVAATSVTTINANLGTTQPVNFTSTGASALVKSDTVDIAGAAVSTSTAQVGVNVVSYASGEAPLQPTVAGRTLDVTATGEAGIDWANIGAPTTTVNLSGTTVKTATDIAAVLPAVAAGAANGLIINGANTGPLSVSGGVTFSNSGGSAFVCSSSGGNGQGISASGNGSGNGMLCAGGATGHGIDAKGGASNGNGMLIEAQASGSEGLAAIGGADGPGIAGYGGPGTGADPIYNSGIAAYGGTGASSNGLSATKGTTGSGVDLKATNITTAIANVQSDTDDIQTRLPAALVGGRMDSSVGAMAANVITSSAIATDAITSNGLATSAVIEIVDGVWDEPIAGHLGTGSTGAALNAAGSAGDPWATLIPGAYGAGTAGNIVGNNVDAKISSRTKPADTQAAVTLVTTTTNLTTNNDKTGYSLTAAYDSAKTAAQAGDAMALTSGERTTLAGVIWANATRTLTSFGTLAADVWNVLTSTLTTVGSIGKRLADDIDATISSRSTYAGTDTPGTTTLLTRIPGVVQPQTGDSFARLGAPAGASVSADIAAMDASILTLPTDAQNADKLLGRNLAGGSDGGRVVRDALRALRNKADTQAATLTVYEEDDATVAWTGALITDPAADPIVQVDPA
jgi:hypothetical protein